MKPKKLFSLISLILIVYMANGQIDPNWKEKNGYLKSNGTVVHSHTLKRSSNTYKAGNNNANALTGKPRVSDYTSTKKGYTKKKVTPTRSAKTTYSKPRKVYKLYAPKTNNQDPFSN